MYQFYAGLAVLVFPVVMESSEQVKEWCICGSCLKDPSLILCTISKVCSTVPLSNVCFDHLAVT